MPISLHRDIPADARVKQVTVKQEKTGEWYAIFGIETEDETPENPGLDEVDRDDLVGIDVGIIKYAHDTDSTMVGSLNLDAEYERLEREQQALSRKEEGSQNWREQRRRVARLHAHIVRKRRDFLHKLSTYYAWEYDLVAVEDLDVHGMMQLPSNSRNRASASWRTFIDFLEYTCEREGTHFVKVEPEGTTEACAECGVEKALWVREHSCPTCGFETDRDENVAYNVLQRGLSEFGVGYAEVTPTETALPTSTTGGSSTVVDAQCVVETGSPTLKERATTVASE